MKHLLTLAIAMVLALPSLFAQNKPQTINLPNYDDRPLHFGFSVGVNQLGFGIEKVDNFMEGAEIYGVECKKHMGLHFGPLAALRLGKYFDARAQFLLSFNQRDMEFYYLNEGETDFSQRTMSINSTMLEVPLLIKGRGERMNNLAPYIVAGGAFRYDLTGAKDNGDEEAITLKKIDPCLLAGLGLDFYLRYFKMSVEIKYNLGLMNTYEPKDNAFGNSIKSIKSNGFTLTFHFE